MSDAEQTLPDEAPAATLPVDPPLPLAAPPAPSSPPASSPADDLPADLPLPPDPLPPAEEVLPLVADLDLAPELQLTGDDDPRRRRLLIKVTVGSEAAERCNQAFTVAATAAASGVEVSLWLAGEASWFAVPGRAAEFSLPHAAPLAELLDAVLESGTVTLCTQCAARRSLAPEDLLPGVRIAGAPVFVEEAITPHTQALVY